MSTQLILLRSGETVVSDLKKLVSDGNEKPEAYLLQNPQLAVLRKEVLLIEEDRYEPNQTEFQVVLTTWMPMSADRNILVPPDWIISIMEPLDTIKTMYEEKVNGENN
jgi:hypothetical protein